MFASKLQIRMPRRITAYFLLFGLAALVWLSFGAVYVARSVTHNRSESASLRWLGHGCDRIVLAYLRDKRVDLQPLVAELRSQSGAEYCAIVKPTGEYLAHSDSIYAGQRAADKGATTDRWGEVVRVEYESALGVPIHEYRSPLQAGGTKLGTLRMAVPQPSLWSYLRLGAQFAPLAFIGPFCCIAAGAVLLNRLVKPVAEIERQLLHVATSPSV
ncbi:MAG TPA: hypothetical protein VH744_08355, partial [Terriglobales bacterium]